MKEIDKFGLNYYTYMVQLLFCEFSGVLSENTEISQCLINNNFNKIASLIVFRITIKSNEKCHTIIILNLTTSYQS